MKWRRWNQHPDRLRAMPEFPVLATLYTALIQTERALFAARPDIFRVDDPDRPEPSPPADHHLVTSLLQTGAALRKLLLVYRAQRLDDSKDDDIPF